jgi:membrane protein
VAARAWQALRNFRDDRCLDLAAGVSFYGLLALAPLLYLSLVSLGALFRDADAARVLASRLSAFVPADVRPAVERLAEELERGDHFAWLAVPALLWVASSAFSSLDYAVNVAFASAPQRKFWRSRIQALAILGAGWCLLTLSLIGGVVVRRLDHVYRLLGIEGVVGPLTATASALAVWAVDFAAFYAFYRLLPRTRVRRGAAAAAALGAVALWEGVQRLIGAMVRGSPAYGLWTGTLTGAAALVVWMYVAISVVLYGAELAAALNGSRDRLPPVA